MQRRPGAPRRTRTSRRSAYTDFLPLRADHRNLGAPACTDLPAHRAEHRHPGAHWCAGRNSRALPRVANFEGRALSGGETRLQTLVGKLGAARVHCTDELVPERARFQRLFGAENRKPTIAQWSVFLPRQGRTRRQASPTIVSLPELLWLSSCPGNTSSDSAAIRSRARRTPGGSETARRRPPGDQALPLRVAGLPPEGAE